MSGWLVLWKCLVACRFGESSQQLTTPQVRHVLRWTHQLPIFMHSSQPSGVRGSTLRTASRCVQVIVVVATSRPQLQDVPTPQHEVRDTSQRAAYEDASRDGRCPQRGDPKGRVERVGT